MYVGRRALAVCFMCRILHLARWPGHAKDVLRTSVSPSAPCLTPLSRCSQNAGESKPSCLFAAQAPRRRCTPGCPLAPAQATGPGAAGRARARQDPSPRPSLRAAARRAPNLRTQSSPPRRRVLCLWRTCSGGAWPRQVLQGAGARRKRGAQPRRRPPRPRPARGAWRPGAAGPRAGKGPCRPGPAGRAACARSCSRPLCQRPPALAPSGAQARAAPAAWRRAALSRRGRHRPRVAKQRRACLQRACQRPRARLTGALDWGQARARARARSLAQTRRHRQWTARRPPPPGATSTRGCSRRSARAMANRASSARSRKRGPTRVRAPLHGFRSGRHAGDVSAVQMGDPFGICPSQACENAPLTQYGRLMEAANMLSCTSFPQHLMPGAHRQHDLISL